MRVVIAEGKGAVFGVNFGRPIVTNEALRSCAEVCAAIELSFWVVSGVALGIHVLDGVHMPQVKGKVWILGSFALIGLMASTAYFVTELYSTRA